MTTADEGGTLTTADEGGTLTTADQTRPVPPVRLGWLLLSLAVGTFAIGTAEFAVMGVLPGLASWLDVSVPSAGRLISTYALGVVVGAPLFTLASARIRYRYLLAGLMIWFAVANAVSFLPLGYSGELVIRFLAGLPHGAFFGVAAGLTTSLVESHRRTSSIAITLAGLTVANIVGVPFSTILGNLFGANSTFLVVAATASVSAVMLLVTVPRDHRRQNITIGTELRGLRDPDVWWSLAVTTLGFGGVFGVVSYLIPSVHHAASLNGELDPVVMATYGCGMTAATVVVARFERIGQSRAIVAALILTTVYLALFWPALSGIRPVFVWVFILGLIPTMFIPLIQSRLIDLSGDGALLPAALTQCAINIANSLGAFAGGLTITATGSYAYNGVVGAAICLSGLLAALWMFSSPRRGTRTAIR